MASSGSLWVSLGLKTDQFTKGIAKAKGQLNGFQKFGAGMKNMFNPLTIGIAAFAGIGLAISGAVKTVKEFEKANSELEAVLGASSSEMEKLSDSAKRLGSETAFTASEVVSLQTSLAKLGFDSSQIDNMTESTLAAAAALGSDLGEQAALTGAVLNSFGLDSKEAGRVNDVLALSAASSALDFGKLSAALPVVASVAKATGRTLEETTATLGVLTSNGLDASSSATALRNIFIKLSSKGLTMKEALAQINASTDKAKTSFDLFGKTSVAAGVILAEQGDTVKSLTSELMSADGAAQRMADTMLNNLSGDITKAGSAYEGFILSLEDGEGALSGALRGITQLSSGFLNYVTDVNKGINVFQVLSDKFIGLTESVGLLTKEEELLHKTANKLLFNKEKLNVLTSEEIRLLLKNKELLTTKQAQELKGILITKERVSVTTTANAVVVTSTKELTKAEKEQLALKRELLAEYGNLESVAPKTAAGLDLIGRSTNAIKENIARLTAELNKADIGSEAFTALQTKIEELQLSLDGKKLHLSILPKLEPIPEEQMEALKQQEQDLKESSDIIAGSVTDAFSSMSSGLMQSMDESDTAMDRFSKSFKNTIVKIISTALAGAMANAIAGATSSGAATGPGAVVSTPVFIATAIAGIIGAFASIPKFADGGIVSGATMGMMGEYAGAKSNPEVIAPLDKLRGMLGDNNGMGGEVKFRIEGMELVGILNRQNKRNKFS